jgi:hypothetical protein
LARFAQTLPQKDSEGKGWKLWSEVAGWNSYTGKGGGKIKEGRLSKAALPERREEHASGRGPR